MRSPVRVTVKRPSTGPASRGAVVERERWNRDGCGARKVLHDRVETLAARSTPDAHGSRFFDLAVHARGRRRHGDRRQRSQRRRQIVSHGRHDHRTALGGCCRRLRSYLRQDEAGKGDRRERPAGYAVARRNARTTRTSAPRLDDSRDYDFAGDKTVNGRARFGS